MNLLAFDSIGGAAGDMILAALIDLGVDAAELNHALTSLGIGPFQIVTERCSAAGLHGLRLRIQLPDTDSHGGKHLQHENQGKPKHHREHGPAHIGTDSAPAIAHTDAHATDHADTVAPAPPHRHAPEHGGRGLPEIRALIASGDLPQTVKHQSLAVFQSLAEAEGRVHQCDPETIHFHEVGALDSILDIVGCCLAYHWLGIEGVTVAPLPLGRGTTRCAHGILPIPVPATLELLRGFPVYHTDEPYELVTPTGAAILTTWQTADPAPAICRMQKTGHGFGTRSLNGRPNLLRAVLMTTDAPARSTPDVEACLELICNLDDMSPEWIGPLIPGLIEAGALDAFLTPIQMKKQRPGTLLTVLCRPADRIHLMDLIFRETTTFGIRWRCLEREVLARRHETVDTAYGVIRIKIGSRQNRDIVFAPEYQDCRQAALLHKIPLREIHAAALTAMHNRTSAKL